MQKKITGIKNLPCEYARSVAGIKLAYEKTKQEFIAAGGDIARPITFFMTWAGADFQSMRITFGISQLTNI